MNLIQLIMSQPTHILWLLSGLVFLGLGMLVVEPAVSALGGAALITAIASLSVTNTVTQILLWGVLSISLAVVLRGMVPRQSHDLDPAPDAEVSEVIPMGGVGAVSYEGSFWTARCQISDITIPVGQTVHVVGRQGNTLIVLPTQFPDHSIYDQTV